MKTCQSSGLTLLPLVAALLAGSATAQVSSPQPPLHTTPTQMVDTLHSVFGNHHARAIHTRGIMLASSFTPSPPAARRKSSF